MNAPRTVEGARAWDVALRCGVRTVGTGAVVGLDVQTALRLAEVEGDAPPALGPLVTAVEAGVLDALAQQREAESGGSGD